MRAGEESDGMSIRLQQRRDEMACGAFSLGAGDMDDFQFFMGEIGGFDQWFHAFERIILGIMLCIDVFFQVEVLFEECEECVFFLLNVVSHGRRELYMVDCVMTKNARRTVEAATDGRLFFD